MTRRLLITGGSGSLGRRVFARAAAAGWEPIGTYVAAPAPTASVHLDIRDPAGIRRVLADLRPDAIVHTASGRDRNDWPSTADGAAHLAVAAAGIRLVHVSSDAVFSGREIHYDESALPDPVYRYGAAKAAAETAVRAITPSAAVVRTSLILGDGNGAHEILTRALIAGRARGALFTDEIRTPVHVDDLADALLELAAGDYAGILNVAGADPISRYDLGVLVARREGLDPAAIPATTLTARGLHRPGDVRLVVDRAEQLLHTRLRGAHEFLTA
ncbi:epimerase [Actinoplanes sp. SE50]|uniref:sugar nucleotide-binding protein n=1 Tax=unclassified Actinoplanes TaxID=2626549 RepID=UPI00023EC0FF|nr:MULTISPECIES: sugar nucleotide-binding protein [unclassified Actinoplanes]AEV85182.1 dTDP-4-dehydrorhamnose reductase [Actinoplanes sp. SE50/110]ATO83577.1 epimerase [Actinoplanes sp. SE50]SLM00984.1 dTDP-4-dehydrorhamnose reductase [Actinoplanes sp. SE50/110]